MKRSSAPPEKIRLLHTGVDLDRFTYAPPWHRYDGEKVRCLFVGRLVEKKAPLHLIRAFAKTKEHMVEHHAAVHLTLAGEGPLFEATQRLVADLQLVDDVTFFGGVSHTEVQQLMQSHHLHVKHCITASDGDQEGQGVTFAEASAVGLPIVSTRHNGIPDVVINGKTGFLVEEGDIEGMGERIAYLAMHPEAWEALGPPVDVILKNISTCKNSLKMQ